MSYTDIITDIENLSHYRQYTCKQCGHQQRVYALFIQANCERCGTSGKLRGYAAIGAEIEDVVDAVLEWLGNGEELEQAMERKRVIDSDDNHSGTISQNE